MEEAVRPGPGRWCHTQCWMDGNSSSQPHKTVDTPTRATLQLLMVKYNNCLVKGFLRKLTLLMVSMSNIFLRKEKKWFLQINLESKRIECIHRVSTI